MEKKNGWLDQALIEDFASRPDKWPTIDHINLPLAYDRLHEGPKCVNMSSFAFSLRPRRWPLRIAWMWWKMRILHPQRYKQVMAEAAKLVDAAIQKGIETEFFHHTKR